MKKREGQALIIVVLIIAIVMAVFANSLTTQIRFHAREETEIYQREQALYLAEIGINQLIFNINSGTTYNDGDSITGTISDIGNYKTVYHSQDDATYGGNGYIESIGTAGEITRKIFASIQVGGNSSEAFKYCLYTSAGGPDGISDDSYFYNYIYDNYLYNIQSGTVPYPDQSFYSYTNSSAFEKVVTKGGSSPTYTVKSKDLGKVIFIHTKNNNATLTVSFKKILDKSYQLSIITDAKNVVFDKMGPADGNDTNWYGAENSHDDNLVYPILVHLGTGTATFKFDYSYNDDTTLYLHGFVYTNGDIKMKYDIGWWFGYYTLSYGEFDGEVIEKNPQGDLGGDLHDGTTMNYVTDYYTNPPPHFISPDSDVDKVLPGSYREEY